jgi:hypothetical protein
MLYCATDTTNHSCLQRLASDVHFGLFTTNRFHCNWTVRLKNKHTFYALRTVYKINVQRRVGVCLSAFLIFETLLTVFNLNWYWSANKNLS